MPVYRIAYFHKWKPVCAKPVFNFNPYSEFNFFYNMTGGVVKHTKCLTTPCCTDNFKRLALDYCLE